MSLVMIRSDEDFRRISSFIKFVFKQFREEYEDSPHIMLCSFCNCESAYWPDCRCPVSPNGRHGYIVVEYDDFKDPGLRAPLIL